MSVVGFDTGNDTSVVAVARRRVIDVLQNHQGRRKTTSMVGYDGGSRILGDDALARFKSNYKNTVLSAKRLLGVDYDSKEREVEDEFLFCKTSKLENGRVGFNVQYEGKETVISAEGVVAAFFGYLKDIGEAGLEGVRVQDCVISVPPYFNDVQRRAMLDAAKLAGLNPLRLMNETTAVALQYGILRPLPEDKQINVLFLDCGHTQTNASVVSFTSGKLKVLATASDPFVGSRNFTKVLVDHFAKYVLEKYKMDVRTNQKAMLKLVSECERVKKVLSANQQAPFNIEFLMNDTDVTGMIDRAEFEALCAESLVGRVAQPALDALAVAGLKTEDLASIEVVGGGIRVPCLQTALKAALNKDLSFTCDGDESVARGCALQCAMLSPSFRVRDFDVQDITGYPVSLAWGPVVGPDGVFTAEDSVELFTTGNTIPSVKMISFKDRKDPVQIVASYTTPEAAPISTKPWIGTFTITGMPTIPEDATKPPKMKVKVKLDMNGVLSLSSATWYQETKIEEAAAVAEPAPMEAEPEVPVADAPADAAPAADADAPAPDAAADSGDAKPMETEETPAPAAATPATEEKEKEKKTSKTTRTHLAVASVTLGGLTKPQFNAAFEMETAMTAADKLVAETNDRRNELESYVLEMRQQVESELKEFVHDDVREKFVADLNSTEDWLYDDGYDAQKSEFLKRIADLQSVGEPIKKRKFEHENRKAATSSLKSTLVKYQLAAASTDEKYAHITAEEREKLTKLCNETDTWLVNAMGQQMQLSPADVPALTVSEVQAKLQAVEKLGSSTMNKPKPVPKKEEAKKEEAPAKMETEETPADAAADAAPAATEEAAPAANAAADAEPAPMDVETPTAE